MRPRDSQEPTFQPSPALDGEGSLSLNPVERPRGIDPWSLITYTKRVRVQRTYSYYRKFKGRKRRVLIEVPARFEERFFIEPLPKPVKHLGGHGPRVHWAKLSTYEEELRDLHSPLIIPHNSYFYRKDADTDVVDLSDGFIWDHVPRSKTVQGLGHTGAVRVVKIWFIMHHIGSKENQLWARSRIIPEAHYMQQAYREAAKLYSEAVGWAKERNHIIQALGGDPYLEVRDMVAWTLWLRRIKPGRMQRLSSTVQKRIEEIQA
jgi:hypothetical protein